MSGSVRKGMRAVCAALALLPMGLEAASPRSQVLTELTIEELSNIEVSSVSRRPEPLAAAPASIYVITGEQIRRSGAVTLPEALRLAPNIQVARTSAREYAISARGFQSGTSNKLLVLIDGRTVYSPLFSGVFWDAQGIVLEDVERIEVISGPGAATWGVNAVNGVINVITRPAIHTQGTLATAGAGNRDRMAALRHGGALGEHGFYRIYSKGFSSEHTELADGTPLPDRWQRGHLGFRADWEAGTDGLIVEGEAYRGTSDEGTALGLEDLTGGHLLARWARERADGARLELQGYYEHTDREEVLPLESDIFDLAFSQALPAGEHALTWGAGYRYARDGSGGSPLLAFIPAERSLRWYHVFAQDQLAIRDDLELTAGVRFEHNIYTDWEILPSVRLGWTPADDRLVWGAVSRAVRSPARLDREIFIPGAAPFILGGGPDFQSEIADVVELGYRAQPTRSLSWSLTAFHHRYEDLRSLELAPPGSDAVLVIGNGFEGDITGVEGWGNWQVTDHWQLGFGGFVMDQDIGPERGSMDTIGTRTLGNDPDYQLMLRSTLDLGPYHEVDVMLRHVGDLPDPAVPSYTAVDLRYGWEATRTLDVALLLHDLFDSSHAEFGAEATRSEFERAVFVSLVWRP